MGLVGEQIMGCNGNNLDIPHKKGHNCFQQPVVGWQVPIEGLFVWLRMIRQNRVATIVDHCDQSDEHCNGAKLILNVCGIIAHHCSGPC